MFIGNAKLLAYFDDIAKRGEFAQGYCLIGPNGIGKRKLTAHLAGSLLQTAEDKVTAHPDYLYLSVAVDEKTGKPKTEISVAQARALRASLAGKPWGQGLRVTVIDQAERLSLEAASALLKIVEEPPEKTVIFFLTESLEAIPATIISRLEKLYLQLVPTDEIAKGLVVLGAESSEANTIAKLAWGRPGRAIALSNDSEWRALQAAEAARFVELLNASATKQSSLIAELTEKKDNARTAETVAEAIDSWLMQAREIARSELSVGDANKLNRIKIFIDNLHEAKVSLRQNVNPRLLLETIFFSN